MEYDIQAILVLRNLVHAETNVRCPETGFLQFLHVITDLWKLASNLHW